MRLSELQTGEKCIVVKIMRRSSRLRQHKNIEANHKHNLFGHRSLHDAFCNRIAEMGFVRGQEVEVILNAPLKDPVKYKVMGYEVSLRRSEASLIEVVRITHDDEKPIQDTFHGIITENENQEISINKPNTISVALVGNPNCGKSTLFNFAANEHEHVGNYGGVTVDAKASSFVQGDYHFNIFDLPGTYSLTAYTPEEVYVRKHIAEKKPDVIVNVIDASNLERNLYLTTQLIDMNVRVVIALNMYDEFLAKGNALDFYSLSKMTGIPIVPTVARTGKGVKELFDVVAKVYEEYVSIDFLSPIDEKNMPIHKTAKHIHINHGKEIEYSISKIKEEIAKNADIRKHYSTRFLSIKLLENDKESRNVINKLNNADTIFEIRDKESERIKTLLNEDAETAITNAKYGFIAGALRETLKENNTETTATTKLLDAFVTHKFWGFPIFILFVWLMFEATFKLGQYPMNWIEAGVSTLGNWIDGILSDGPLKDLLIDGIIGGVGGVIIFLPNILILYLFISFMEDSGYMARAAFIMDKIMRKAGLNGKSFIPLIMGFGCSVPAIMAARTIENRSSRMITILINPLISCSARLPVYILLVSAFFKNNASLVFISIYALGIFLAIVVAKILKLFFFRKDETPFVMELPPYRIPTVKSTVRHMWEKGQQYLRKMGTIILIASIVVWFLGYFPHNITYTQNYDELIEQTQTTYSEKLTAQTDSVNIVSFLNIISLLAEGDYKITSYELNKKIEHQEQSYIGRCGKFIEPVIRPLGFNWKIGIALVSGVAAKEIVVSTLSVLYTGESEHNHDDLSERIKNDADRNGNRVFTPLIALSLMVFILLYFPCIATITAISKESGRWKWGIFTICYTIMLAWIVSFAVYQIGLLIT
ncbi:MAG: ferrous iron transport protein B [Prevotellaceae bacterium]|jgi:ferrous iron transport protein B|nr:ferrous iron transport protein B [Prevotellaceae bacterium]